MRRPGIRSLAGGAAGIVAGVIGGIALTSISAASGLAPAAPGLDAVHVPPVLTRPGEAITLRYAIVCPPRDDGQPCDGSGSVYARAGQSGSFRRLALSRGDDSGEGRYFVDLPREIAAAPEGFSYYAVLRDDASRATVTIPAGGETAPQRSFPLRAATEVALGRHTFGRDRAPDERIVAAPWGAGVGEAGLRGSRDLGYSGPSSFDVAPDGTVAVLDQVNARVERWSHLGVRATDVEVSGGLADFALEPGGTMDVLEPPSRANPAPVLRSFREDGSERWTQRSPIAPGPSCPLGRQARPFSSSRRSNGCRSPSMGSPWVGLRRPDAAVPVARSPTVARWWSTASVQASCGSRSSRATRSSAVGASRAPRPLAKCSSRSRAEMASSS